VSSEEDIVQDILNELESKRQFDEDDIEECRELLENNYRDVSLEDREITLERAEVNNFEAISAKEIDFQKNDTVLYGENTTGKTSFIEALEFNLAGRPDHSQYRSEFELTNLIRNGKSSATTNTYWEVNGDSYRIYRILKRDGGLVDYPRVTRSPETTGADEDRRDSQSKVSGLIGILPLEERLSEKTYDLYRILGLFFITSKNWRLFMDWDKSSDMLDILFRVNLTNVINASEARMEEKYYLDSDAQEATYKLENKRSKKENIGSELRSLEQERDRISTELADLRDQLRSVRRVLKEETGEGIDADELQSRKSTLESREANIERQLTNKAEELAKKRRLIRRYEDTEMKEDMDVIADEVRNLMTVPEKCPVCTNSVDNEQRTRFLEHNHCPLCSKEVPEDRRRVEKEYQADESITAIQEKQQEKLEGLEQERDDIEYDIDSLQQRLEDTRSQLDQVEATLDEGQVGDLIEEREELEQKEQNLEEDLVKVQGKIDSKQNQIEELEDEIEELEVLVEEFDQNNRKRQMLSSFNTVVRNKRDNAQRRLKDKLEEIMLDLTEYFTEGTFSDVKNVEFPNKGEYSFEIHKEDGTVLDSTDPQESTAEVVLHAILFHTAVLKELSQSSRNLPFRLFVIDSAFTNEQDRWNKKGLANFLSHLPEILSDYQLIISMADLDIDNDPFEQNYRFERF
jgi:predicted  nucleic acid-binding Zn-ribbon protein